MTGMDDLLTWLRAQLDDDERVARVASTFPYDHPSDAPWEQARLIAKAINGSHAATVHDHLARWTPKRVLAEVDAKRRILDLADDISGLDMSVDLDRRVGSRDMVAEPYSGDVLVKLLALPYADRDGYREEWRP